MPFYRSVVQLELAELFAAAGRAAEAGPAVSEARDTFERLGATPWLARVDAILPPSGNPTAPTGSD